MQCPQCQKQMRMSWASRFEETQMVMTVSYWCDSCSRLVEEISLVKYEEREGNERDKV